MLLEVFSKEALVGEAEVVGDLLDALRGVFQQVAELKRHVGVDPLVGRLVADLLDDLGEILRGDAQLQGVPPHAALLAEVLFHELDELHEDVLGACPTRLHELLRLPDGVACVVDESLEEALHRLSAEVVIGVANLRLDKREEVDDVLLLLLVEMINRMHT